MASGTIAINPSSQLYLGGIVSFDWSVEGLKGNQNPRIQLMAYQDGEVVYGEAHNAEPKLGDPPFDGASFQLGGASSQWLENGGPADCVATLYYWDNHPNQVFVALASVEFHAEGAA